MLNKLIFTTILVLSSTFAFSAEIVDVTINCVIEGHGGGCQTEWIELDKVEGAASIKITETEEDCYDDLVCEFCTSTIVSEYTSSSVNYLSVNVEAENNSLVLTEGSNDLKVNFYDAKGSYLTTQFLTVNASVEVIY